MKTHEEYLIELTNYSEEVIRSSTIQSSEKKGTLGGLKSFLENYQSGIERVSGKISEKANNLLQESKSSSEIDSDKLKVDLTELANELAEKFIIKTNKRFKQG